MFYTQSYPWKWVCSQHPMILISRDMSKPRALETVPPWGALSIHGYCQKMYEMLVKVLQTPKLKIDFDISAKELLIFFEEIPDGRRVINQLILENRVGFVGGDYTQAHYHEANSESALRQIRMGAKVFKQELGIEIDTFQHQETGLFENLPQILSAFGIRKAAVHTFSAAFRFIDSPSLEIMSNFGRLELVNRETFANWCGLDGTCIPIYLPIVRKHLDEGEEVWRAFATAINDPDYEGTLGGAPKAYSKYPTAAEENRGLAHNGSVIIECPDMISVNDEYIHNRLQVGTFWRMSDALEEELKRQTYLPRIRYYTYWSYCEGEFGEMMFKGYRKCERKLLMAETMQVLADCFAGKNVNFDAETAWDLYLTAQHHDVNWMDTTELKQWSMAGMERANRQADDFFQQAAAQICGPGGENYAVVFNTLPKANEGLVELDKDCYRVFDGDKELPVQIMNEKLCFKARLDGLGYQAYRLEKRAAPAAPEILGFSDYYDFENETMRVRIMADGRITSLYSKKSGERIKGNGNLIKGQLVFDDKSWKWISNENACEKATVEKGPLFDIVCVEGRMADIPYEMKIYLPHGNSGRIDFELLMRYDKHTIGDYYHDESKMNIYWELNQNNPQILADEPYGAVHVLSDRPIHAAGLVAMTQDKKGIIYYHNGTPKHWVKGNTLANLIAWGGRNFTNRSAFGWSGMDIFDMRLDGIYSYNYAVEICETDDPADILNRSSAYEHDLNHYMSKCDAGKKMLLKVNSTNWVPTAVEMIDGEAVLRGFDISGKSSDLSLATELKQIKTTDVAGNERRHKEILPYEIVQIHLK